MKEGTHKLMTLDFWLICISNFLLYAGVWTLLPVLSAEGYLFGLGRFNMMVTMLLFVVSMIGIGPLHAYLGDVYRRNHVLMASTIGLGLCAFGSTMVTQVWQLWTLVTVAGALFGIATTAGITVAIDITKSQRRGAGNRMYAFSGALGLLVGLCLLSKLYFVVDFQQLVYGALILWAGCLVAEACVYVPFRAPEGVGLLNLDRFFLPKAWLPAINVCALAIGIGMTTSLLPPYTWICTVALLVLAFGVVPLTKMFVKLSHHCQRGTANTTMQLAMMTGLMVGMVVGEYVENVLINSLVTILVSLLAFPLVTLPYFREKRVRK